MKTHRASINGLPSAVDAVADLPAIAFQGATIYVVATKSLMLYTGATLGWKAVGVIDVTAPTITLKGNAAISVANAAALPATVGATAVDDTGEYLSVSQTIAYKATAEETTSTAVTSIDTSTAGVYTVTYTATDAAGNAATPVTQVVTVAAA